MIEYSDKLLENFKKVVQNYAGLKKESVAASLRKTELDERIVKFIKQKK